ncbi:MAG: toxic anion resistance protein [Bryobacterales bacterium]|nr:toxic anion resistance protein [Bryobacterales bacterium]
MSTSDSAQSNGPATAGASSGRVAKAPRGLDEHGQTQLAQKADQLALAVLADPGDRKLGRQVSAMGVREQQKASREIGLLKTRVGTMLSQLDGEGAEIPRTLIALRHTMDEINPQVLGQPSGIAKLLGRTPGVGKILKRIAVKYESVQTQIDQIMAGLRHGKDKLLQDSTELEQLYEQVHVAQQGVQQSAYVGELLMQRIEDSMVEETETVQRQKLQTMAHKVSMRVQDLRTMEQVNLQFFSSIDMTLQNNDSLCEQIDRTVMVTQSLLTVGLAIQAALANQKQIATAVKQVQDSTAAMLEANAAAIGRQTREIGEMQNHPVIALDRVRNAYESLVGAMDEMEQIRMAGTEKARAGISELTKMSAALEPKVEALRAAKELPASEIPGALELSGG